MMISTRERYALRVLTDLAEHSGDGYISALSPAPILIPALPIPGYTLSWPLWESGRIYSSGKNCRRYCADRSIEVCGSSQ